MDLKIVIFFQKLSCLPLDIFFQIASYMVSWVGAMFLLLMTFFFCSKKFAGIFSVGYLLAVLCNFILKEIISRPRPYESSELVVNKLNTIGYSMPSGHAVSAVFLLLTVIFAIKIFRDKIKVFNNKKFCLLSYFLAGIIFVCGCVSRLYLGQHYLTDILAGIVVGCLFFVFSVFIYKRLLKKNKSDKLIK